MRPTRLFELHDLRAVTVLPGDESRPDNRLPIGNRQCSWCPRKDSNLQPLVCRTSAPSIELLGHGLVVGVGIEPTSRVLQTRANPSQLSDLTIGARGETRTLVTGFAIRRLSRLATRAKLERKERFELSNRVWKTRMFPTTSLPQMFGTPGRTRTRNLDVRSVALFQLSHRSKMTLVHRTGFEPMSQRWQRRVLNQLDQRCKCEMVGMDRVELSPRVPKTRMLTLHHTPKFGAPGETRTHNPLLKRQVP